MAERKDGIRRMKAGCRRAEVQRQMVIAQIMEVNMLLTQLRDAMNVADRCGRGIVVLGPQTAKRMERNLEDLEKRFLVGLVK